MKNKPTQECYSSPTLVLFTYIACASNDKCRLRLQREGLHDERLIERTAPRGAKRPFVVVCHPPRHRIVTILPHGITPKESRPKWYSLELARTRGRPIYIFHFKHSPANCGGNMPCPLGSFNRLYLKAEVPKMVGESISLPPQNSGQCKNFVRVTASSYLGERIPYLNRYTAQGRRWSHHTSESAKSCLFVHWHVTPPPPRPTTNPNHQNKREKKPTLSFLERGRLDPVSDWEVGNRNEKDLRRTD